ncbi:MAG: hypothetical protein JNL29_00405 [Nitrospira sp.]|nr:hypothetical protein [Nitrospira sp.]
MALLLRCAPPWWGLLALEACLGGSGIIGASANVVIVDIARKAGYRITFFRGSLSMDSRSWWNRSRSV